MTYSVGTITLTNGSRVVTGTNTKFFANVLPGFLLIPVGGAAAVIAEVNSDTQLTLVRPWVAATLNGTGYDIVETSGGDVDLSLRALAILNTFGAVRDGVGQGLFPDGTVATPALRFTADQDTGVARLGADRAALVAGGVARLIWSALGVNATGSEASIISRSGGAGTLRPALTLNAEESTTGTGIALDFAQANAITGRIGNVYEAGAQFGLAFSTYVSPALTERFRISASGNVLAGVTTSAGFGNAHRVKGPITSVGNYILSIDNGAVVCTQFLTCDQAGFSQTNAAQWIGRAGNTGRSINAGGTINASGADYAEYMVKADGCGTIEKGDVCGVDGNGHLTKTWADAVSFVIKSTDPSLVGGDTWDADVGPKPEEPGPEPGEPAPPVPPAEDADDAEIAAWRDAMAAYPAQIASYQAARAEWQKATDDYAKALPVWEAAHEKARQCVDRIAFCGQVPANVSGDFEVGDYIIASASGAGIKAVAVKADDMSLPQYMRRIGKVWAVRDGRAWIDVQHG